MNSFTITIQLEGKPEMLHIQEQNHIFEVFLHGTILCALKPPGEDWQLLPLDHLLTEVSIFERDLKADPQRSKYLHATIINQITGEIENHLKI